MDSVNDNGESILNKILDWGIHFGEGDQGVHLTIGLFLVLIVVILITQLVIRLIKRLVTRKMNDEDKEKTITVIRFAKYSIYLVVILITLSAGGVDITLLITASAALFVGIGLALQGTFQDILGGMLILIDKSLKVGDIIEIDNKVGKVFEIKLRTTRALTRDDKVIVIPNHKFMTDLTYNYTQNHKMTREAVHVGVAYGSDLELVSKLLLQSLEGETRIADHPKPFVLLNDFSDSSLQMSVHFFLEYSFQALKVKSKIRFRIDQLFRQNDVRIPFPQRDVHLMKDPEYSVNKESGGDSQETI